jgi:hypothetical protein
MQLPMRHVPSLMLLLLLLLPLQSMQLLQCCCHVC